MGTLFWLAVLVVLVKINGRKCKKRVEIFYRSGSGQIAGDQVVFDCGCRFAMGSQERRFCTSHEAIVNAEVSA